MIEYTYYQCETCRASYPSDEDAYTCEASHWHEPKIIGMDYQKERAYPRCITVEFENGKKVLYSNVSIITSGEPEK